MTSVTTGSIAYIATQVRPLLMAKQDNATTDLFPIQLRFALSSSSVFCRSDTSTDSARFYESVLHFLDHPDEKGDVNALLLWWNR
jgi:hypothetical protein